MLKQNWENLQVFTSSCSAWCSYQSYEAPHFMACFFVYIKDLSSGLPHQMDSTLVGPVSTLQFWAL